MSPNQGKLHPFELLKKRLIDDSINLNMFRKRTGAEMNKKANPQPRTWMRMNSDYSVINLRFRQYSKAKAFSLSSLKARPLFFKNSLNKSIISLMHSSVTPYSSLVIVI